MWYKVMLRCFMQQWHRNLSKILGDPMVEAAILARIRFHDENPNSWVVLDAFQKYFSTKNITATSNFFHFGDGSCLKMSQEGVLWEPRESAEFKHLEDCAYSSWYIAQRVGIYRWSTTFLKPFPLDD